MLGEAREAVLAVTLPEGRGFRRFCDVIGPGPVTEFNYRFAGGRDAHVFVGVELAHKRRDSRIDSRFSRGRPTRR